MGIITLDEVEKRLRRLPIGKLKLLKIFADSDIYINTAKIADLNGQKFVSLGGTISSLVRTKVKNKPLIQQVGKDNRQAILRLNNEVISNINLKELLNKII